MSDDSMRAELKLLMGFPHEPDRIREGPELASFKPIDPTDFGIDVQALIGTPGDEAADSFDIVVCSPRWLESNWTRLGRSSLSQRGVFAGRGIWLMANWDFDAFHEAVEQVLERTTATKWGDLANRIGRFLPWEYEYRYDDEQDVLADT